MEHKLRSLVAPNKNPLLGRMSCHLTTSLDEDCATALSKKRIEPHSFQMAFIISFLRSFIDSLKHTRKHAEHTTLQLVSYLGKLTYLTVPKTMSQKGGAVSLFGISDLIIIVFSITFACVLYI